MSYGIVWVESNSFFVLQFGSCPVPIVCHSAPSHRGVSFSEGVVNFQCLHLRCLCSRVSLLWSRIVLVSLRNVAVSHPGIGQGVVGVYVESLLEILDCFFHRLLYCLIPVVAA